jgi:hypothetical protein
MKQCPDISLQERKEDEEYVRPTMYLPNEAFAAAEFNKIPLRLTAASGGTSKMTFQGPNPSPSSGLWFKGWVLNHVPVFLVYIRHSFRLPNKQCVDSNALFFRDFTSGGVIRCLLQSTGLASNKGQFTHAMPRPCRAALIHTCHAALLSFSDGVVSFVKVRVVAGNIRTDSPTV